VPTVAQDNNELATAASHSETIHYPEEDTQTDEPISKPAE
jgi:hypothetical protein